MINTNKKVIIDILYIVFATIFISIGVGLFLLPNKLSSGGFSGIATIIYYYLKIPMGISIILLNVPLFILAFLKVGRKFLYKTLFGTILLSAFINLFEQFNPITNDKLLACIYGGILIGIGTGLVLLAESSTGGSELLSIILQKFKPNIKFSNFLIIVDIVIILANVIFFNQIEIGLYSAIAIFMAGKMVDIIFEGIYYAKLIYIISDNSEQIAKEIEIRVERGITGLEGKGMYTNKEKLVLMCVVSRRDVGKVKKIVKEIDKKSFVIVTDARETVGEGFKK